LPVPPLGYSSQSRDNVPDRVPGFIVKGTTTREDVLLGLGTPDAHSPDGRWFAYRSERHTGGVVFVVAAGYSAGGAGFIGYEERLLIVHFDTRSTVTEATMAHRVCPRGVVVGPSGGGASPPCLKVPDLTSGQPPELLALRTFYVTKSDADTRNIHRLIEAALRRKGLEATTGPANETPKEIDAILTYEDVTDSTGRISQLTTRMRAPGSKSPFAAATSRQTAPAEKTPEEMVAEVVAGLFSAPGRPFLTLPPYRPTLNSQWVASPLETGRVRIEPVRDARAAAGGRSIGERSALGFWIGNIDISPMPTEIIDQLLRAELTTMGHRTVDAGADVVIDARVTRFEVRTPSTLIYWDIDGVIAVDLGVTRGGGGRQEFHYEVTCTDRTYVSLSEALIGGVVSTCLANLGRQVREDRGLSQLLARR
jgi:hypothetical protein